LRNRANSFFIVQTTKISQPSVLVCSPNYHSPSTTVPSLEMGFHVLLAIVLVLVGVNFRCTVPHRRESSDPCGIYIQRRSVYPFMSCSALLSEPYSAFNSNGARQTLFPFNDHVNKHLQHSPAWSTEEISSVRHESLNERHIIMPISTEPNCTKAKPT